MLSKIKQFVRDVRQAASLKREIDLLQAQLDTSKANGVNVHNRLDLTNLRIAHIEQYLGLRKHTFPPQDTQWKFQQVRDDVQKGKRPESAYHVTKNDQARAAKQTARKRAA